MSHKLTVLLFLLLGTSIIIAAENARSHNRCPSKTTCHECIRTPSCAWCSDPRYGEDLRCYKPSSVPSRCRNEFVWNPDNRGHLVEARQLMNASANYLSSSSGSESAVQISPQRVSLKLRVNEVYIIHFHYAKAEDPQYESNMSSVEIKDNATGVVRIGYKSSCLDGGPSMETNMCDGLKVEQKVKFEAMVEVTECPTNPEEWHQTILIYPVGILESLIVNLDILCDCPCEWPSNHVVRAPECSGRGTYKCGMCECEGEQYGQHCECSFHPDFEAPPSNCRPDNVSTMVCSGRGLCICGMCKCHQRSDPNEVVWGRYCECDNFSCDRSNGLICSGPAHGRCDCGQCSCYPAWTGMACDCYARDDMCVHPRTGSVCSDHGECTCGQCRCHENDEGGYIGRFCEHTPGKPGDCQQFKDCVQCQVYQTGPLTKEECAINCTFIPITSESIRVDELEDEILCSYFDEDECRFQYVYTYHRNGVIVRVQEKRDCPPESSPLSWFKIVISRLLGWGQWA